MNRFLFSAWMARSDSPTQTAKTTRPPRGFPLMPPLMRLVNVTRTMIAQLTGTPIQSIRFLNWKKSAISVHAPTPLGSNAQSFELYII
jgi:hypothetical protein